MSLSLSLFNGCFRLQCIIVTSTLTKWTCFRNTPLFMKSHWHTWNLCGSTHLPSFEPVASWGKTDQLAPYLHPSYTLAKEGLQRIRFKIPNKAGNRFPKIQNLPITMCMREIMHSCPTYGKPECKDMNLNTKIHCFQLLFFLYGKHQSQE